MKMKSNTRALSGLLKSIQQNKIRVGWLDSKDHWDNPDTPVAQVAATLYYDSPWGRSGDSFMWDRYNHRQLSDILGKHLKYIGAGTFREVLHMAGEALSNQLARNIVDTDTPSNSLEWAAFKGFNKPLQYGSLTGRGPNLISEITYKVGKF